MHINPFPQEIINSLKTKNDGTQSERTHDIRNSPETFEGLICEITIWFSLWNLREQSESNYKVKNYGETIKKKKQTLSSHGMLTLSNYSSYCFLLYLYQIFFLFYKMYCFICALVSTCYYSISF